MDKKDYTSKLETVIKQMLIPLNGIPLNLVIESICGYKIIPFDNSSKKDLTVLNKLIKAVENAGKIINKKGILRRRPNEVGNDIESYIKDSLNKIGYLSDIPKTKNGRQKAMGYPDIEFIDEFERINYLECKTYNIENLETTQRSFYLSPSEEFKITKDAHHFAVSFEIFTENRKRLFNVYKCKSWKIITLEDLDVDVKYEFNSDNSRMYAKNMILAEGKFTS